MVTNTSVIIQAGCIIQITRIHAVLNPDQNTWFATPETNFDVSSSRETNSSHLGKLAKTDTSSTQQLPSQTNK